MNEKIKAMTIRAQSSVGSAADAAKSLAGSAADLAKSAVRSTSTIANSAAAMGRSAAGSAAEMAQSTVVLVGDLNGDGKVDIEDAKIAMAWAKKTGAAAADEAGKLGKEALKSDLVKDAAGGAIVGGAIASVVPGIGSLSEFLCVRHNMLPKEHVCQARPARRNRQRRCRLSRKKSLISLSVAR